MEGLAAIVLLIVVLALVGVAATVDGVDTRDGYPEPPAEGRMRWGL